MRNPNWMAISNNQLARQSAAREKVASLGQRKSEVLQKLMDDGTYKKILDTWGVSSGVVDKAEINPSVE